LQHTLHGAADSHVRLASPTLTVWGYGWQFTGLQTACKVVGRLAGDRTIHTPAGPVESADNPLNTKGINALDSSSFHTQRPSGVATRRTDILVDLERTSSHQSLDHSRTFRHGLSRLHANSTPRCRYTSGGLLGSRPGQNAVHDTGPPASHASLYSGE
jgi:hypothetical protein